MIIYGYARCSTNESKQNIERQIRELKEIGATDNTIFIDWESGSVENRKELQKLLNTVSNGDCIATVSIDRITRSTKQLIDIIEFVEKMNLKLILGNFIVDCTSNKMDIMTEALLKVVGVFSELERKMICARVQSGIDNARAKGIKLGRPKTSYKNIPSIFFRVLPKYQNKEINLTQFALLTKLSIPSIYKYLEIIEK
jgi:DNA invertase Pin-like site-specific DNA recombinase